jgi:hypothetical protein
MYSGAMAQACICTLAYSRLDKRDLTCSNQMARGLSLAGTMLCYPDKNVIPAGDK